MVFKLILTAWIFSFCLAKELLNQKDSEKIGHNIPIDITEKFSDSKMNEQDFFASDIDLGINQDPIIKRSYFMCLFRYCPIEMRLKLMQMYNSDSDLASISHLNHLQIKRKYLLEKKREKNFRDFISMRY